ncbi:MAG: hypothetical protein IJF07_01070 [Lachnospiraceae bacterium]|nr:hypothetical protein [Lachnospiraceae bacterium]
MQELLRNAWQGWLTYNRAGKFAALLIAVLLFFWFYREEAKEKLLLWYTTIMTICCVVPVSAAFLMKYQTAFYSYDWIWNYVPVILMIAYGITVFLTGQWECYKKEKTRWKSLGATLLVVAIIVLCGRMGQAAFVAEADRQEKKVAEGVLETIMESAGGQEICLWAPREIVASTRAVRGDISLIYGRNIWDAALGSYFYETYNETEESLYLWMCHAEETGSMVYQTTEGEAIDGVGCVQMARNAGVNRILLPNTLQAGDIVSLEQALGVKAEAIEDYYLFVLAP